MDLIKGYKQEILDLYEASFPDNERKDLSHIFKDTTGISHYYAIVENQFLGFIITLTIDDITHIIYFAILPEYQNKGLGSKAIQLLNELVHQRIIVDIEESSQYASNNEQRIKRKQFYIKNHFIETEVKYNWHQDDYEIMCLNGTITKEEFHLFWENIDQINPNLIY